MKQGDILNGMEERSDCRVRGSVSSLEGGASKQDGGLIKVNRFFAVLEERSYFQL